MKRMFIFVVAALFLGSVNSAHAAKADVSRKHALAISLNTLSEQALAGNARSQTLLGLRYLRRNRGRAIALFCHAAAKGEATAAYQIGSAYMRGDGVSKNTRIAASWYTKAARLGHAKSRKILAILPKPKSRNPRCPARYASRSLDGSVVNLPRRDPPNWALDLARDAGLRHGVDPGLILAVISAESGFNHRAVSPKGARGLMQLMPATARRLGVKNSFDKAQNINGGTAYLSELMTRYSGDLVLTLAAYNAGENAVARYDGVPPYAETKGYIRRIAGMYRPVADAIKAGQKVKTIQ